MSEEFNSLLKEAVEVANKADALGNLHKLKAGPFLKAAMEIANVNHKRLDTLEEALKHNRLLDSTRSFYRNAIRFIREPNCVCPPASLRGLRWLARGGFENLQGELSTIQSNVFEVFALAARDAVKRFPQAFGDVDDMEAHYKELKEAEARRAELYHKIGTTYGPDDIDIGQPDGRGMTRPTFKISGGEVPLGPVDNAGERLVNWLRQHPNVVKKL